MRRLRKLTLLERDFPTSQYNLVEAAQITPVALNKREAEIIILEEGPGNKVRQCWYGPEAIRSGKPIFEGVQVYANHPRKSEQTDLPERDVNDLVGRIKETWVTTGDNGKLQLRGILKIMEGKEYDKYVSLIKESINAKKEGFPPVASMSIHADGDIEKRLIEGTQYNYVTNIKSAVSVDIVTKGGIHNAGFVKFMESVLGGHDNMDRNTIFRGIQQKLADALTTEEAQFLENYLAEGDENLREAGDEQHAVGEPEVFEDENGNLFAATGETDEMGNPILMDEAGQTFAFGAEEDEQDFGGEPEFEEDDAEYDEPEYEEEYDEDDDVPVTEMVQQFPHLAHEIDQEERHVQESFRDPDIVALKLENKLLKSRAIAQQKLAESGLPAGYVTMAELVGQRPDTMDRIIEAKRNQLAITATMIESAIGATVDPESARGQVTSGAGQRILRGSLMPR